MTNESNDRIESAPAQPRSHASAILGGGLALAAIAIIILGVYAHQLTTSMSALQETVQAQNAKLTDQLGQITEASNQRLDAVAQQARESAMTTVDRARAEVRRANANLSAKLAEEHQTVAGDLDQLKQASSDADSKLTEITADVNGVKGDVSSVKGDVASTQTEVQQHGSELKRMTGDMGVMSGLIATNGTQLNELRQLGERDYVEFDLKKGSGPQKIGTIQLVLDKADPKRNRFTVDVLADDKRVQKRDRTINEPVQLYVSGNRLPTEIVVNQVKKDEVVGYLAVPKVTTASR